MHPERLSPIRYATADVMRSGKKVLKGTSENRLEACST